MSCYSYFLVYNLNKKLVNVIINNCIDQDYISVNKTLNIIDEKKNYSQSSIKKKILLLLQICRWLKKKTKKNPD